MKKLIFGIMALFVISGCGGGSSSSTNQEQPEVKEDSFVEVNGRVVDGEIEGARVFLDKNRNGLFDDGELNTKSDSRGYFTLKVPKKLEDDYTLPILSFGGYDIRLKRDFDEILATFREKSKKNLVLTPISTLLAVGILDRVKGKSADDLKRELDKSREKFGEILGIEGEDFAKNPTKTALESGDLSLLEMNMKIMQTVNSIKKSSQRTKESRGFSK